MKIHTPVSFLDLVLRRIKGLADAQSLDQPGRPPHLVQAFKMFAQRLLRLTPNDIGYRRNQLVVTLLQVHVEPAWQQNRVPELKLPNLRIMYELRNDFVAVYPARRSL